MSEPTTVVEALEAAYKLIEKEEGWTQNTMAEDRGGVPVDPLSGHAVCFCSIGALRRVLKVSADISSGPPLIHQCLAAFRVAIPTKGLIRLNDESTHEQVLDVWRRVIEYAKWLESTGPNKLATGGKS